MLLRTPVINSDINALARSLANEFIPLIPIQRVPIIALKPVTPNVAGPAAASLRAVQQTPSEPS